MSAIPSRSGSVRDSAGRRSQGWALTTPLAIDSVVSLVDIQLNEKHAISSCFYFWHVAKFP